MPAPQDELSRSRKTLRDRLIAEREQFGSSAAASAAAAALGHTLRELLLTLEPEMLGLYWAVRSEFNAAFALRDDKQRNESGLVLPLALPYARRAPPSMTYRRWNGEPPAVRDECGIASIDGEEVVPDVVVVPCVGFTRAGFRIGYGGGFFDRWLAKHPGVTSIGVAWSIAEVGASDFVPEAHDQPLTLILTENGVVD